MVFYIVAFIMLLAVAFIAQLWQWGQGDADAISRMEIGWPARHPDEAKMRRLYRNVGWGKKGCTCLAIILAFIFTIVAA
jgi:hypothetical protein